MLFYAAVICKYSYHLELPLSETVHSIELMSFSVVQNLKPTSCQSI